MKDRSFLIGLDVGSTTVKAIVTDAEAALSLPLTVTAILAGWRLAPRPRRHRTVPRSGVAL